MMLAGPLLQQYFTNYLIAQRRLSPQTLASYRDTFRLLLQFVQSELKIEPAQLAIEQLDAEIILRFLDNLELQRKNSVVSRNLRLTAIRSFFRMVALHHPECVGTATRVLAIPMKRTDTRLLEYVSRTEMDAILNSIDRKHWCGRRDYALLLTMYNSGARVSELCALRIDQIGSGKNSYVHLHGKGRKERAIPLWPSTARILRDWLRENTGSMAFPGVRGEPLSRFAVRLLLQKAVATASSSCSSLRKKRISPHTIRHGTAMALLDAGVDISVIALWLGHESIETTNGYLHTSIALKEKALAKVTPSGSAFKRFKPDDRLLAFLASL
ncbi:tyrosine-type recombinase/integrase [Granulicella sp. L60]|uniref:tyrosine-type recombinase/integrase n=1 Tax=Granulicella sp. L60 TaxID=1641866 RepID=UPI00131B451D|nr:tyrosine-type recombinase/integrase [Granulicella sp. L60]